MQLLLPSVLSISGFKYIVRLSSVLKWSANLIRVYQASCCCIFELTADYMRSSTRFNLNNNLIVKNLIICDKNDILTYFNVFRKYCFMAAGMMGSVDWQSLVSVDKTLLLCLHFIFFSLLVSLPSVYSLSPPFSLFSLLPHADSWCWRVSSIVIFQVQAAAPIGVCVCVCALNVNVCLR